MPVRTGPTVLGQESVFHLLEDSTTVSGPKELLRARTLWESTKRSFMRKWPQNDRHRKETVIQGHYLRKVQDSGSQTLALSKKPGANVLGSRNPVYLS